MKQIPIREHLEKRLQELKLERRELKRQKDRLTRESNGIVNLLRNLKDG